MDRLAILSWNANGLRRKTVPLKNLMQERDADIVLINETHLTPAYKLNIPGYVIYRQDQVTPDGRAYRGLAVLVRRRVVHQQLPQTHMQSMYALGIEICLAGKALQIYAVYKAPQVHLDKKEVTSLLQSPTPTLKLLAGDFNCKNIAWNSNSNNYDGTTLLAAARKQGFTVQGPELPTHYPVSTSYTPDVLDIVVHNLTSMVDIETLLDDLQSDHAPVLITMHHRPATDLPRPRKMINWEVFSQELENNTPNRPTATTEEVNLLAEDLSATISEALKKSTTSRDTSEKGPPLPIQLRRKIEEKKLLIKSWRVCRCPVMRTRVNKLAEQIKDALVAMASSQWEERLDETMTDWSALHRLCRQFTRKAEPIRPLLHKDNTLRYRAKDRAEIFAEHLETQFTPNPVVDANHTASVEQTVHDYLAVEMDAEEDPIVFSPGMVQRAIRRAKPRKAPGLDGVTNAALRHLPHRTLAAITRLFNGITRTGAFPNIWKSGQIVMLPKPGKNIRLPASYRPITLLPALSKIFEKLLLRHLVPHITPREEQFGFRQEHSTTLQLIRVLHAMTAAENKKEKTALALLDMEKAFDRVWHQGLVYKLSMSSTPRRVVKIIASFLEDRTFQVRVQDDTSDFHPIQAGVPQGSCLSPTLYCKYTDDIPVGKGVQLALYADDAAYISISMKAYHAARKLQDTLDLLPDWLNKWRLSVNASKTQLLMTTYQPSRSVAPIKIQDTEIPWLRKVKYLGITIDSRLSMMHQTRAAVQSAKAATLQLRPIFESSLPMRKKLGIYKIYVRPRLTYAAPAWFVLTSEDSKKKMRSLQSKTIRRILKAPPFVRNTTLLKDTKMETIDQHIGGLTKRLFERADATGWSHIRGIAPYHRRPPDRKGFSRDLVVSDSDETDDGSSSS